MDTVSVRYLVHDVDSAVEFYTQQLDFVTESHPTSGFATLARGQLRLLLSATQGSGGAAQPMPDGRRPEPGGWNRIQLTVHDLDRTLERLRVDGASFRNDLVVGYGGRQILLDDPCGNPVELFEPRAS